MPDSCFHRWQFVPHGSTLHLLVHMDGSPVVARAFIDGGGPVAELSDAQLRTGQQSVLLDGLAASAYTADIWLLFEDKASIVVDAWVENPGGAHVAHDMTCTLSGKTGDTQAIAHLDIGLDMRDVHLPPPSGACHAPAETTSTA